MDFTEPQKKIYFNYRDCQLSPEKFRAARLYGESTFNMIVLPTMYIAHNAFAELSTRLTKPEYKKFKTQNRKVYFRDAEKEFNCIMESCIEHKHDDATRNYLYRYNDLVDEKFHSRITDLHNIIRDRMQADNVRDVEIYSWLMVISGLLKYSCHVCECITDELSEIFHASVFNDFQKAYTLSEIDRLMECFIDNVKQWCPNIRDYNVCNIPETDAIIEDIDSEIRRETILESSQDDAKEEFDEEQLLENQMKAQQTADVIGSDIAAHHEKYKNLLSEI